MKHKKSTNIIVLALLIVAGVVGKTMTKASSGDMALNTPKPAVSVASVGDVPVSLEAQAKTKAIAPIEVAASKHVPKQGNTPNAAPQGNAPAKPVVAPQGNAPAKPVVAPRARWHRSNLERHWEKHGAEFPEFHSAQEYGDAALNFFQNPPEGTLTKVRPDGEKLYYHPPSNTFGVTAPDGTPKTLFRPSGRMNYWNRQ